MFNINDDITSLKGVGPKTATPFFDKGITSVNDLLKFLPISYITYNSNQLIDNSNVVLHGTIISRVAEFRPRRNLLITNFSVTDGENTIKVVAWNQRHLKFTLKEGMNVEIIGKYDQEKNQVTVKTIKECENDSNTDKVVSVYSKVNGVSNPKINKLIIQAIEESDLTVDQQKMLMELHYPTTSEALNSAINQFKIIEFTNYVKKLEAMKKEKQIDPNFAINIDMNLINQFINNLPYSLTIDQQKAINSGLYSLNEQEPMQSLVLGDVGSGKTVVSLTFALATMLNNKQVAMMLPTEILAKQVYAVANNLLADFKIALLTSSTKAKEKKLIKAMLQTGAIDLIIGTHSLIEDDVEFANLSLAIIDEQHRFGVNQRDALINKGQYTNYCYLSATPIPRTLAHSLYGVIDVIEINSKPANRKPITTTVFKRSQKKLLMEQIDAQLASGNQVFVVTPLAYEVEDMNIADSMSTYESFAKYYDGKYKVGMINGQLKSEHKDIIMDDFREKNYDILIATTVIEVGVDVPGATCIAILNAERFGLATLHQLRGRVGRNDLASYCLLYDESNNSDSEKRLRLMETIDNGYELAKIDYEMRGMGELAGIRQSGNEDFILFDLIKDRMLAEDVLNSLS